MKQRLDHFPVVTEIGFDIEETPRKQWRTEKSWSMEKSIGTREIRAPVTTALETSDAIDECNETR